MDRKHVVVGFSLGTSLLLLGLAACVCGALLIHIGDGEYTPKTVSPALPLPELRSQIRKELNELQYGPVNTDARKEVKNGLFDRIRARRVASQSPTVQRTSNPCCQSPSAIVSYPQCTIVETTDCNAAYSTALPVWTEIHQGSISYVPTSSIVTTGREYPAINPLEVESLPCDTCVNQTNRDPRKEAKTGGFVCSHCKRTKVGSQWHTDWAEDGTPITFLCEECYRKMTPNQRLVAYKAYAQRQAIKGHSPLQQELGE
jgi:hypothetical protein